ncbi:MAG: NAD(P)/FAD-dependent oxidoreductase [Acidobacteria bacterium]|nr:NAD(P)/FAD-dependent oxidoreductase [Acidobacteriota bacterium]MCA1638629.1 NAD(P)/FAD-dependent oxidoreductase [Acidobacteriota bacterium]
MTTEKKKVLIIGGGFGGLFTALDLAGDAEVTLVSETNHFTFRPLLYEYFSGEVEAWHIAPDYKELIGDEIIFVRGAVETIDFKAQTVKVSTRNDLFSYDALVLAVGGITNFWNIEGAEEFALPFRDVADADKLRREMEKALDAVSPTLAPQDARDELTFAVVGGGASGVELATKMSDLLTDAFARRGLKGEPHILLFEMSDRLVPGMGKEIREYVEKTLLKDHIDVNLQTRVLEVKPHGIVSEHNCKRNETKTVTTVWTAGVKMNPLIEKLELPKDKNGLILVEPTMQVKNRENVFALGDIAKIEEVAPILAGTAQLAFQESALAANNIRAFLSGKTLKTKHFEELGEALSLGTKNAAVLIGGNVVGGYLARDARFALYTSRLPTWHHRLKVGASWFFEGTTPKPLQPLGIS